VGAAEGRLERVAQELHADARAPHSQRQTSAEAQCQQGCGEDQLGGARVAEESVTEYLKEQ
jgi:hypothetical protein